MAVAGRYGGVAKQNKFITRITPRSNLLGVSSEGTPLGTASLFQGALAIFQDLEFLCETSELPGRTLQTADVRYYGPVNKFPFQSVYADLNLTFICRSEMHEKDLFDSWMQLINPVSNYDFRYKDDYSVTIEVFHFAEIASETNPQAAKPTYQVYFENAYPISVSPISLTWADDGLARLQVTFAYDRHYRAGELPGMFIPNQ